MIALFLHVGLALFFVLDAVALFSGASVVTATSRGLLGLVAMGFLGLIAGTACGPRQRPRDGD